MNIPETHKSIDFFCKLAPESVRNKAKVMVGLLKCTLSDLKEISNIVDTTAGNIILSWYFNNACTKGIKVLVTPDLAVAYNQLGESLDISPKVYDNKKVQEFWKRTKEVED